jgi:large subunit ribosomal protein L4
MQRRQALLSSLAYIAKSGKVVGLTEYTSAPKTKTFITLLSKLPVQKGRRILFVMPARMDALERGSRNVPGVRTILASYLNPEDLLSAHAVIFLVDALKKAEEMFGKNPRSPTSPKKPTKNEASSDSSVSSVSSASSRKSSSSSKKAS